MPEENNNQEVVINIGNQINSKGKTLAGILLVLFTILPVMLLIAYWPDKLPSKEDTTTSYQSKWFHVQLLDSGFIKRNKKESINKDTAAIQNPKVAAIDTLKRDTTQKDTSTKSSTVIPEKPSPPTNIAEQNKPTPSLTNQNQEIDTIDLNNLLLILVVIAGFLGSMIHIASSFTNFVGSDKFNRNWTLWYIVKPFTGSALAIVIYFVFRAGLLNFNDPASINLFGIVTLAAFAGLFADDATLKLKEVFEVVFRPKDVRTGKLDENQIKITGIKPEKLVLTDDNKLVLSGEGFDKKKLILKINDQIISNAVIKGDSISFSYKIPEDQKEKKEFKLVITDENGKELYSKVLGI